MKMTLYWELGFKVLFDFWKVKDFISLIISIIVIFVMSFLSMGLKKYKDNKEQSLENVSPGQNESK